MIKKFRDRRHQVITRAASMQALNLTISQQENQARSRLQKCDKAAAREGNAGQLLLLMRQTLETNLDFIKTLENFLRTFFLNITNCSLKISLRSLVHLLEVEVSMVSCNHQHLEIVFTRGWLVNKYLEETFWRASFIPSSKPQQRPILRKITNSNFQRYKVEFNRTLVVFLAIMKVWRTFLLTIESRAV